MRASVAAVWGRLGTGSVVTAHRLSCSEVRGIFPDQGSNPCLLHCEVDSLPLSHQGRPGRAILNYWTTWEVPYFLLMNSVCLTNSVSHTCILKNVFKSAQWYPILWTLWTLAHKAPLSMGFCRQEYWRGLPFPPPEDLPYQGVKPASSVSPALQVNSLAVK